MGLDNGIYVKSNKRKFTRKDLPKGIIYPFDKDYDESPEICYWRKCWGIRGAILDLAGTRSEDLYYTDFEKPEDVISIIRVIVHFMIRKNWEDEGDSIWDYNEILPQLENQLVNLALIYSFMKENPDVYLTFYDSY